ncbi:DUF6265 family protein [Mucilaginibacter myungsuensis]|uniref:DUF6265 domain-containing protein n=1 Tax=Mucilaginibacter myungsuensis TaxID=649104 RepID=A0A929L409_9SPHI|nr:DUF6265 family protein [Mucilaginibacter myungsuensis]MBE9662821.1 hypothetical protein [Mucilaginibacter myungsuensis]MDN3598241.1 DUF6265 family protein [Mucilaginibacter myungsuensis]
MKRLLLAAAAKCLSFTTQVQQDAFKPLHQLAGGTWKMKTARGYTCEQRTKVTDTELSSKGFNIRGTDTVPTESVKIKINNGTICYIPIVKGQNGGKPVEFKLTSSANNVYQFSNPGHDYPQVIAYELVSKDSINAWIEGDMNGQKRRIDFHYKREK